MSRTNKLEILRRKQKAKSLFSDFANDIRHCFQEEVNNVALIDLETTFFLIEKIESVTEECENQEILCIRKSWNEAEIDCVYEFVKILESINSKNVLYLIRPLSEYCGAITTVSSTLGNFESFVSLNQDDFVLVSNEAENGVIISYNTDKFLTENVNVYDLLVWGEKWVNAINSNYQTND